MLPLTKRKVKKRTKSKPRSKMRMLRWTTRTLSQWSLPALWHRMRREEKLRSKWAMRKVKKRSRKREISRSKTKSMRKKKERRKWLLGKSWVSLPKMRVISMSLWRRRKVRLSRTWRPRTLGSKLMKMIKSK